MQTNGELSAALKHYVAALELFSEFPEAHQNIAHLYEIFGDNSSSKKHHQLSIIFAPSDAFKAAAIVNLVTIELKSLVSISTDDVTRLINMLNEAELLASHSENILYTKGLVFERVGDFVQSLKYFNKALSINPKHSLSLLSIGNWYFKRNDFKQSTSFYIQALSCMPSSELYNSMVTFNNLGQSYREQGMLKLALRAFQQANETEYYGTTAIRFWSLNNIYTIQGMLRIMSYWSIKWSSI